MELFPGEDALDDAEGHADDWSTQEHERQLVATAERLRAELDRLRADHARMLAESEGRYWALAESLNDIIVVLDAAGEPARVAGNTMGILGYTHRELMDLGAGLWDRLVHPQDVPSVLKYLARDRYGETSQRVIVRARDRAEEWRWLELSVSPVVQDNAHSGLQVTARDVSERVQNERMLASLNTAVEVVQRAAVTPDSVLDSVAAQLYSLGLTCIIALLDRDDDCVRPVRLADVNDTLSIAERVIGLRVLDLRIPWQRVDVLRRAIDGREVVHLSVEEPFIRQLLPDAVRHLSRALSRVLPPLKAIVAPLVADDHVLGILGVAGESLRDTSVAAIALFASQTSIALRNAQLIERLRESERRYRGIFEATTDALLVVDRDGVILEANPAAGDIVGRRHDDLLRTSAQLLMTPESRDCYASFITRMAKGEQERIEVELVGRDGHPVPAELRGALLSQQDGSRLLLVFHDMSEQVRARQALVRSEKLDVLGQMAAGIAHDFNNILVSIRGYADVALMDLTSHPELVESDVEHILAGAGDAAEAIRRLQSLYRQADDTSDFSVVQLEQLVTEALALTQPQWKDQPQARGATVEVVRDLHEASPVAGNASELRRVLANLIVNAIDAMPDGGTLTVSTGQEGEWCHVHISDTGAGIAPPQLEHIFEPFYTTKGGRGSGLGLTVSQNIIQRHGGTITVDSAPGEGATFAVRLPATTTLGSARQGARSDGPIRIRRGLRVLVVDDESSVRLLLTRLLARDGHIVREASGGREALSLLDSESFDLLITDLGMPEVSGHIVAQRARETQPALPVILSTGWGETISPDQLRTLGAAALLAKPFTYNDLQRAMATIFAD